MKDDFLGAFGVLESAAGILMVQNQRLIDGRQVETWDLPGGGVEAGELLQETLARELREETGLQLRGRPEFLFVQEGERRVGGERCGTWRSFFFRVASWEGIPEPGSEVQQVRWMDRPSLEGLLTAPYHDSFLTWLSERGGFYRSVWSEQKQ